MFILNIHIALALVLVVEVKAGVKHMIVHQSIESNNSQYDAPI